MFIGNNNSDSKLRIGALVRIPSPVIRVSTDRVRRGNNTVGIGIPYLVPSPSLRKSFKLPLGGQT